MVLTEYTKRFFEGSRVHRYSQLTCSTGAANLLCSSFRICCRFFLTHQIASHKNPGHWHVAPRDRLQIQGRDQLQLDARFQVSHMDRLKSVVKPECTKDCYDSVCIGSVIRKESCSNATLRIHSFAWAFNLWLSHVSLAYIIYPGLPTHCQTKGVNITTFVLMGFDMGWKPRHVMSVLCTCSHILFPSPSLPSTGLCSSTFPSKPVGRSVVEPGGQQNLGRKGSRSKRAHNTHTQQREGFHLDPTSMDPSSFEILNLVDRILHAARVCVCDRCKVQKGCN